MKRVLIVEDSSVMQKVLRVYLSGLECEFHSASSGREGLEVARRIQPHIVISDIQMPGGTGIDLCRLLRAAPSLREIPIILIGAQGDIQSRHHAMQAGADAFLAKPIDSRRLFMRVSQLLDGRPVVPAAVRRDPAPGPAAHPR